MMDSLWNSLKKTGHKTVVRTELLMFDRDIKARQQQFGIDLYEIVEPLSKQPAFFASDDKLTATLRPPMLVAQREISALQLKKTRSQQDINQATVQRQAAMAGPTTTTWDKLKMAGNATAFAGSEAKSMTERKLIENEIATYKQNFGVAIYPIFEKYDDEDGWLPTDRSIRSLYDACRSDIDKIKKRKKEKEEELTNIDTPKSNYENPTTPQGTSQQPYPSPGASQAHGLQQQPYPSHGLQTQPYPAAAVGGLQTQPYPVAGLQQQPYPAPTQQQPNAVPATPATATPTPYGGFDPGRAGSAPQQQPSGYGQPATNGFGFSASSSSYGSAAQMTSSAQNNFAGGTNVGELTNYSAPPAHPVAAPAPTASDPFGLYAIQQTPQQQQQQAPQQYGMPLRKSQKQAATSFSDPFAPTVAALPPANAVPDPFAPPAAQQTHSDPFAQQPTSQSQQQSTNNNNLSMYKDPFAGL